MVENAYQVVSVNAKAHMRVQSVQVSFLFNLLIFFTLFLQLFNGDLEFGTLKKTLTGHTWGVYALTTLSNGDLVSGSGDNTIKIWSV
jgi:WD40 repeat protein